MRSLLSLCVILSLFIGISAEPHAGSAAVTVGDGVVIVTGGRITNPLVFNCEDYTTVSNECHFFDGVNMKFAEINDTSCPSFQFPRVHHTAVEYNGQVYLFGGAGENNDIEVFDTQSWSIVQPEDDGYSWTSFGDRPTGRHSHGAFVYEDSMYIFGGIDAKSGNALNDIWRFNFVDNEWQEWEVEGWVPQPRAGFSFTLVNDKVYLFGGFDTSSPARYFNDLWFLDLTSNTWKHAAGSVAGFAAPESRAYHVAGHGTTSDNTPMLFIHGGMAPNRELNGTVVFFGDFWSISLATLDAGSSKWWKFQGESFTQRAGERAQHAIAEVEHNTFAIFSGIDSSRETLGDVWGIHLALDSTNVYRPFLDATKRAVQDPTGSSPNDHDDADPEWDNDFGNHGGKEHGDWDEDHQHYTGHIAMGYIYSGLSPQFIQADCFEGYFYPYCVRDCSANNWCSGNGQCLSDGSCHCNAGYYGDSCEKNECAPYKGFTSELLNEILLPKAVEATYMKLDAISKKLEIVRDLLPNIKTFDVDMQSIAEESHHFFQSCLVDDLCETTECFEELIGCDVPCGAETFCLINDVCVDNQCVNGTWRDCGEEFGNNKCVHSWCDETHGCMHSTVSCDDGDMCTEDTCDPDHGCVHKTITCGDEDCCTLDQCNSNTGMCEHKDKCEDFNPCTIDICNNQCQFGSCEYELEDCCYMSVGQTPELNPAGSGARPLGEYQPLDGTQTNPPQTFETSDFNKARSMYWLRACDCELIYDIEILDRESTPHRHETGAHIYGTADENNNAGVVYSLPLGNVKKGVWNFCESGVNPSDLVNGLFYTQIYFNVGGPVRGQITFMDYSKRDSTDSFRG